jgi:predicted O-methyltransferase YrrM
MALPTVPQSSLDVRPIDWAGLPRRFMNEGELEVLVALVASAEPRFVVEIGVNEGRTAKAILRHVPGIRRYLGVDVEPGYVPAKAVQRHEAAARPGCLIGDDLRFELILKPRGSLDLVASDLMSIGAGSFRWADAFFIDGDHGAEAVAHDTRLARACVRPGGIIVWHDYHDLGTVDVRDVLDDLALCGADLRHVAGTWLVFERR